MELKYKSLYKNVLKEYQKFSTCARVKVAALLVEKGRIISVGYNGVPSGQRHCNEKFSIKSGMYFIDGNPVSEETWLEEHHKFANEQEIHAEQNCLGYAAKWAMNISGASMVLSHEPCEACARLIFCCGIKYVYYVSKYDRGSKGIEFLENNGVTVEQI